MARDLIVTRVGNRLVPTTPFDLEVLEAEVKEGVDVQASFHHPRSLQQNKFYWKMLGIVVENHDFYVSSGTLHIWLKVQMGMLDRIPFHDGGFHWLVGSTAFHKMRQSDFQRHVQECIILLTTEVLPGVKGAALIEMVEAKPGVWKLKDL